MTINMKAALMSSGAFGGMTANEQRLGRFIRDGEGHPAPAPAPAPAAEPAPSADTAAAGDDFAAFESSLDDDGGEDDGQSVSGTSEPATPSADDDQTGETPTPDDKGASVEERIADLTGKWRETERQLAEANRRLDEKAGKEAPPAKEEPTRNPGDAPNPEDYEFGEADGRYIADLATHSANVAYDRREREAATRAELAQVEAKWSGAVADPTIAQQYPDFAEKVTDGAKKQTWDCSALMAVMIKDSEVGPHVAYHLASNPAESKRIAALGQMEQAIAMARLEGRFEANKSSPAARIASKAPTPPPERARGAGGKFGVEPDTEDFAAFDKLADGMIKHR